MILLKLIIMEVSREHFNGETPSKKVTSLMLSKLKILVTQEKSTLKNSLSKQSAELGLALEYLASSLRNQITLMMNPTLKKKLLDDLLRVLNLCYAQL
jgi:hypothetical protein